MIPNMNEFVNRLLRKTTVLRIFQTPLVGSRGLVKTRVLMSCAVIMQLICAVVFTHAKAGFLMMRLI